MLYHKIQILEKSFQALPQFVQEHSERVGRYTQILIGQMAQLQKTGCFSELFIPDQEKIKILGRYHDIGKLGITDEIWNSSDPLSKTEKNFVHIHPIIGAYIVKDKLAPFDQEYSGRDIFEFLLQCCLFHHENWNGTGYPFGLKKEQIPVFARIVRITDAYDAMTADRPYRKRISSQAALREIETNAGRQFDPDFAEIFCSAMQSNGIVREEYAGKEKHSRDAEQLIQHI